MGALCARSHKIGPVRGGWEAHNEGVLWLHVANYALIAFHTALVVFNCTGWIWPRTRRLHLVALAATAVSWVILGLWFGQGYCICTDLHWRVRAALGERVLEQNYIQYLVAKLTGWTPSADLSSKAALGCFLVAALLSVWVNLKGDSDSSNTSSSFVSSP